MTAAETLSPTEPMTLEQFAETYGRVAEREFNNSIPAEQGQLLELGTALLAMDNREFTLFAEGAILDDARMQRFRGMEHVHCRSTMAFVEATRRVRAAGHTEDCRVDSLYARAFARAARSAGHDHMVEEPKACTCGAAQAI